MLLCVLPSSTATPERSFSHLRLIKNYMRTSMQQERLNHLMVAAVHRAAIDDINVVKLMKEFINRNEERRKVFAMPDQ